MEKPAYRVRRDQTLTELIKLKANLTAWLDAQDAGDRDEAGNYLGFQKSRIAALRQVFVGAADVLEARIAAIDIRDTLKPGDVYKACREFDQAVVWLYRIFMYYREKFDQRTDKEIVGPLLQAADEMVWSCYREVYKQLPKPSQGGPNVVQKPPPLPYIAPDYSPAVWDASREGTAGLSAGMVIQGLDEFINNMPVPLLRLPPWCVGAPWWLIFVGHEIGHVIQSNLSLTKSFRDLVGEAAVKNGFTGEYLKRWGAWSEEIFADLVSVLLLGNSAGDALVEIEWSGDTEMVVRREKYPPRAARLSLLDAILRDMSLGGLRASGELRLVELGEANPEIKQITGTLKMVRSAYPGTWMGGLGSLPALCNQDGMRQAYQAGLPGQWARTLAKAAVSPNRDLRLPRILIAGAYVAWQTISSAETDRAKRQAALEILNKNVVATMRKSGPTDETRAGRFEDAQAGAQTDALVTMVLNAGQTTEGKG